MGRVYERAGSTQLSIRLQCELIVNARFVCSFDHDRVTRIRESRVRLKATKSRLNCRAAGLILTQTAPGMPELNGSRTQTACVSRLRSSMRSHKAARLVLRLHHADDLAVWASADRARRAACRSMTK